MEKEVKKVWQNIKKFWDFIWNGKGWLSWITFLIIIFIFIKLIFFPVLSFLTGTALPLAIVESCSMYHGQDFDDWWEQQGKWYENNQITKQEFQEFPLKNGFNKGDIFFILGTEKQDLEIGDTIIFASGTANRPIIHRVVSLEPLATKGDHNDIQFIVTNNAEKIDETNIKEEQIIGKVTVIRLPLAGWIKLIFFEPFRPEHEKGFCKI